MFEVIESIEEGSFNRPVERFGRQTYYTDYDGYIVTTDKQQIKVGISNDQSCCEHWGYLTTNDDINEFIGAEIREVRVVDGDLTTKVVEENNLYEPCLMFVNFETNRGTLQLVAYNDHNGYYGHSAVVISEQLNHEETL